MESGRPRRDEIADALRSQIIQGKLEPGTRIREERIAEERGVSRVPVREAIQRLAAEGWLVLAPRRGATVAAPSPARALDLMEVRRSLEVLAAQRAALWRGGSVASELSEVVKKGTTAARTHRHRDLPALIDRFHHLVAVASGNQELVDLLDQIRPRVNWLFAVDLEHRSEQSWADHAAILDAILAGDPRHAARCMDEHVERDEALCRAMWNA